MNQYEISVFIGLDVTNENIAQILDVQVIIVAYFRNWPKGLNGTVVVYAVIRESRNVILRTAVSPLYFYLRIWSDAAIANWLVWQFDFGIV